MKKQKWKGKKRPTKAQTKIIYDAFAPPKKKDDEKEKETEK